MGIRFKTQPNKFITVYKYNIFNEKRGPPVAYTAPESTNDIPYYLVKRDRNYVLECPPGNYIYLNFKIKNETPPFANALIYKQRPHVEALNTGENPALEAQFGGRCQLFVLHFRKSPICQIYNTDYIFSVRGEMDHPRCLVDTCLYFRVLAMMF